uniref:Uncharacterized protein n=1 Tax=Tanacetum cinerariifolium TaxID=118510 RepID=A0A6L2NQM2_TANCI|nr:hypothetical protein [Tanacetum cinerariifolium]
MPYPVDWNTPYRSIECQYAILSSQNMPYCLEELIRRLDCRIQYVVLGKRFDTSYPTGGYGVSVSYGDEMISSNTGIEDSHHGPSDAMHNPPEHSRANIKQALR